MTTPIERFRRDNDYEVVRETIDLQIARHRVAMRKSEGRDPTETSARRDAIVNLNEARALIDPDNPATIEIARHLMRSYRADREPQARRRTAP